MRLYFQFCTVSHGTSSSVCWKSRDWPRGTRWSRPDSFSSSVRSQPSRKEICTVCQTAAFRTAALCPGSFNHPRRPRRRGRNRRKSSTAGTRRENNKKTTYTAGRTWYETFFSRLLLFVSFSRYRRNRLRLFRPQECGILGYPVLTKVAQWTSPASLVAFWE